jgi:nitroimidazol reductase NimA-like FMN-containing flavoprotein (pyridoxamine 5'-phosphate oxidase superfamily)
LRKSTQKAIFAAIKIARRISMESFARTERTTLKRLPQRGSYDRELVYRILDEGFICHVGFNGGGGQPYVIPTAYGRVGDKLYLHGSAASRMARAIADGIPVCVTVTLVDGLVLARSAFHHSINYRSVVILGTATMVEVAEEKMTALRAFTEHVIPGRWDDVREPNEQELKGTTVLALPLIEVSAKVRVGPPKDDLEDHARPVWAGELPLRIAAGSPVDDPELSAGLEAPEYVTRYTRQLQSAIHLK